MRLEELVPPHVFWFSYGSSEHIGLCTMTGEEWADHRGSIGPARSDVGFGAS